MKESPMKSTILFSDALKIQQPRACSVMVKPSGSSCNLHCTYCYYLEKKKLYPNVSKPRMSEELLELFIQQYIEANEVPYVTFTWQGGEPTLMGIDFFQKAIRLQEKYANGKKINNTLQTNGTLLNDDWCNFLHDNNILVGISLDGTEKNHDMYRRSVSDGPTFHKVMKSIELFHKHKVEFNTLSVVNSSNAKYATETYHFLKGIGSTFMQFLPVVERLAPHNSDDSLELVAPIHGDARVTEWSVSPIDYGIFLTTIFDEWVRNDVGRYFVQLFDATLANYVGENPGLCCYCETCGNTLVMEHNGDVYSCDHLVYPEYYLGNIRDTPISEIVKYDRQFDFGIQKRNSLPRKCLVCQHRSLCHGECPKHRFVRTPDGEEGLNYLCPSLSLFFSHVEPYMSFMAKELKANRAPANVMTWIKNKESQVIKGVTIPQRNDPCPCGSGKKFKNCCMGKPLYK